MAKRFEYKVEIVRASLIGDKIDRGELEDELNERAREGWQLKSIVETAVKGRIGPGATEGLLAVFERPAVEG